MQPCKTLFIDTQDLENVQRNKKKKRFVGHQVSSNQTKESKKNPLDSLTKCGSFLVWMIDCK
jgi:hypothetical protein